MARNLDSITTRTQAMKALKAMGFVEPGFIMTRGTKLLTGYGMSLTLSRDSFIALDLSKSGRDLGFVPAMLSIGNTSERACEKLTALLTVLGAGDSLPWMGLVVGIGQLAVQDAAQSTQA